MPQSPGGYQGFHPADDWPRLELASFSRVIDYDARTMREEQVRRQGSYPTAEAAAFRSRGNSAS